MRIDHDNNKSHDKRINETKIKYLTKSNIRILLVRYKF